MMLKMAILRVLLLIGLMKMNKEEILEILKKYDIDKNEVMILSGASMVMHGVKEKTNDIDIAASPGYEKKLLQKYDCKLKYENVYKIDDKIEFWTNYFDYNYDIIDGYKFQKLIDIIKLKEKLNREKDQKDIKLIKEFLNKQDINSLSLAYLGDAIYEVYIRKHLIENGICKVKDLQKEAIKYVSAKAQSNYLEKMISNNFFTEEEINIIKRARNHKSHSSKNTDIITYKKSTGIEALIGYLEITNNEKRIDEIMNYIVGD